MPDRLTATEIRYRKHIAIAANSISELRATDVDRLLVELPEALDSASFLRWLLAENDLSERARGEATTLLGYAERSI